ncbi:MAG: hypothetical protein AB7U23_12540 [Dehalococcoidia bacterium]
MSNSFEITTGVSEPFSQALGSGGDDRSLPVGIGGRAFIVDTSSEQFSRRSVDLLNTQQAESGKDASNLTPEVWRRAVESWHQGAAQDRYDREDALPSRYKASVGIDPWTKYEISLLPRTEVLETLAANKTAILKSIGATLFVILETTVHTYADAVNSTSYTSHALADPPIGAACDGEVLYILDDAGVIHSYDTTTSTWNDSVATVPTLDPDKAMIAYVKGFLLIGNGPKLLDYTNPAAPTTVVTHRLSGWWWRSACEGLSVIYVLGGMGDRWHVTRVSIQNTGAALDPPIVACTLPEGEFAYAVASYLNYVLIGVHNGWRFAISDTGGTLTYGQAIRTPRPVKCFEGQDRFVWFGMSLEASDLSDPDVLRNDVWGEDAGLGRADLSTFVSSITPAAASDLASDLFGTVTDVCTVGNEYDGLGLRVFAVTNATTGGVYIEHATEKVPDGWLRQGYVSFNSADRKMGLYGQVFHEPLDGAINILVDVDGKSAFTEIGANAGRGSTTLGNMAFTTEFNTLEMKYVLTRSTIDATKGPRIKRTEFRALNIPGRTTEWRIPLIISEAVEWLGATRNASVASDYDYLMNLIQTRAPFTYREGDREWTLHATDFLWQPTHLISDGTTYQGTFTLVAREIN